MVSKETELNLATVIVLSAIIIGIFVGVIYFHSISQQKDTETEIPDNNNTNPNPPTDENDTNTNNTTDPEDIQDYFDKICAIEPKAEVCIKPTNSTNSTS